MSDIAYVNGIFSRIEDAKVSIDDRGLQFGDSVYEVVKTFRGRPFLLREHLERLREGLITLGIHGLEVWEDIPKIIAEGLSRSGEEMCIVYIQVTRGTQERSLIYRERLAPNVILTFRKHDESNLQNWRENGVRTCTRPDLRWAHCSIKTTNLLSNVILRNEAARLGCYEAILYKPDMTITEACASSVFLVKNETVYTAPLSENILPGVNRNYVVNSVAPRLNIPLREENSTVDEMLKADEVFITSTSVVLLPVTSINEQPVGSGKPGKIAARLLKQMLQDIDDLPNLKQGI